MCVLDFEFAYVPIECVTGWDFYTKWKSVTSRNKELHAKRVEQHDGSTEKTDDLWVLSIQSSAVAFTDRDIHLFDPSY